MFAGHPPPNARGIDSREGDSGHLCNPTPASLPVGFAGGQDGRQGHPDVAGWREGEVRGQRVAGLRRHREERSGGGVAQ